jgi:predicted PurR-regulated permease PerM
VHLGAMDHGLGRRIGQAAGPADRASIMTRAGKSVTDGEGDAASRDHLTATFVELAIRLGALGLLLYFALVLVGPFISIVIWSVVIAVALYPAFEWTARRLGGRRRLAAALITIASLLVVIGPATWLALGLIDSIRLVSEQLDLSTLALPHPPVAVKSWPLIGDQIYNFWDLASTNLKAALAQIAPQLKPLGSSLLGVAADTGTGIVKFFAAIILAGFLFAPAPSLVNTVQRFSRRLVAQRGDEFVKLAGATIRTVSRGVVGISALQALLAGLGLMVAGVPGASLITSAVLILGIIQIGPSVVLIPVVIWAWTAMEPMTALLFTAYMVPVGLLDNVLRPILMGRGVRVPMLVILIGVVGGTLAYGITGLFLGPIVLSVMWELGVAWINEPEPT